MSRDIRADIVNKMQRLYPDWTLAEQAVAKVLVRAGGAVTQQDIARSALFLGAHPRFENQTNNETTLRRVRQIIHDLKVVPGIVIVSSPAGYWIPRTLQEAEDYLDTMERQAKSAARSYMVTARAMTSAIGGLRPRGLFEVGGIEDEEESE